MAFTGIVWTNGDWWCTQILADQLTLFQPGGTDYAHLITTGTPGFSDLPTALLCLITKAKAEGQFSTWMLLPNINCSNLKITVKLKKKMQQYARKKWLLFCYFWCGIAFERKIRAYFLAESFLHTSVDWCPPHVLWQVSFLSWVTWSISSWQ